MQAVGAGSDSLCCCRGVISGVGIANVFSFRRRGSEVMGSEGLWRLGSIVQEIEDLFFIHIPFPHCKDNKTLSVNRH